VTRATPLIEQPLLASFNGRVEAVLVRGNTMEDIRDSERKRNVDGVSSRLDSRRARAMSRIGARLAENLGARWVTRSPSSIRRAAATPFGTVPRIDRATTVARCSRSASTTTIKAFVVMPIAGRADAAAAR
jgi:lipoprotein-releasing system permease protein